MKIWKFYIQAENGFSACIFTCNASNMLQAIYKLELEKGNIMFDIIKVECL